MKDLISLDDITAADLAELTRPVARAPYLAGSVAAVVLPAGAYADRLAAAAAVAALGGIPWPVSPADLLSSAPDQPGMAAPLAAHAGLVLAGLPSQDGLRRLAQLVAAPVVSLGSSTERPLHALADMQVLVRALGGLVGRRLAYVGLAGPARYSLARACALAGVELAVTGPGTATSLAEAVSGADAVYLGTWTDRNTPALLAAARRAAVTGFRLTPKVLGLARPGAVVLHEGPCRPGLEVDGRLADAHRCLLGEQQRGLAGTLQEVIVALLSPSSGGSPPAEYGVVRTGPARLGAATVPG